MATKDLSRTIIEGGRTSYSKKERRKSHRALRAQTNQYKSRMLSANDAESDVANVPPKLKRVRKEFNDKIGGVYRWLRSNVGKPWNDTYSKLRQTFDTRTLASWHVVFDHILRDVSVGNRDHVRYKERFFVDEEGILRLDEFNRWRRKRNPRGASWTALRDWRGGRYVMDYGTSVFWMVPTALEWRECSDASKRYHPCKNRHRDNTKLVRIPDATKLLAFEKAGLVVEKDTLGEPIYFRRVAIKECKSPIAGSYKQGRRLTPEETLFWNGLSEGERDEVVWPSLRSIYRK